MTPRTSSRRLDAAPIGDGNAAHAVELLERVRRRRRRLRTRRTQVLSGLVVVLSLALYGVGAGSPTASAQTASAQATAFTFTGGGWGHGVGMSQWGARGMAAAGSSSAQILTHYYSGTSVGPGATSDDLMVLVAQRTSSFTVTTSGATNFDGVGIVGANQAVTVTRSGDSVALSGAANAVTGWIDVVLWSAGGPVTLSTPGYAYRYGVLRISPDPAGGLRAVIWGLPMQQYLYGLGEMPSSWPAEALKAQATASRTYAQKKRNARTTADFDLYGSTIDQAYTGTRFEVPAWTGAVDASAGQVITYGGQLIDAVYSASSGGATENSEYVWVATVPYLRSVADPTDGAGGNPNAAWSRTYSGDELGSWFGIGTVTSVQVLGPLGASGRVDRATIRLTGTGGVADATGANFRTWVNSKVASGRQLMSTKFAVDGSTAPTAPTAPANTPPTGGITLARADGRTVIVGGDSRDPDGWPLVRVVSTMGNERAVRDYRSTNGSFLLAWTGSPGTRNVCVTVFDEPTGQPVSLGCVDIVVK